LPRYGFKGSGSLATFGAIRHALSLDPIAQGIFYIKRSVAEIGLFEPCRHIFEGARARGVFIDAGAGED